MKTVMTDADWKALTRQPYVVQKKTGEIVTVVKQDTRPTAKEWFHARSGRDWSYKDFAKDAGYSESGARNACEHYTRSRDLTRTSPMQTEPRYRASEPYGTGVILK